MVGRIVWAYAIVMCGELLLCPAPWLLATAMPTPDNETVYDIPQENNVTSNVTTGAIWEITETAGNKSEEDSDGLLFRGGWTSKKQNPKLELETEEGWLHSGIIANDAFIPYRTVGTTNRLGNSSEEWKNLLVKPEAHEKHRHGRVTKVEINEKRDIPFQYRWRNHT